MVFEAHGRSFPCTLLLLFNDAKVNIVLNSVAPLIYSSFQRFGVGNILNVFKSSF